MVGHAGIVDDSGRLECGQDATVQGGGAVGSDLLLHGTTGDLVTEPHHRPVGDEESGCHRFVQCVGVGLGHVTQQVRLDPLPDQGRNVENVAARW